MSDSKSDRSSTDPVRALYEAFGRGDRAEAEAYGLELLRDNPEQIDALHVLGVLAHLAAKNGLALSLLERAARLAPLDAQVRFNLGVVLTAAGNGERARGAYREALVRAPRHVSALRNLANLAFESEALAEARLHFQEAARLDPKDATLWLALGMTALLQVDLELARTSFEAALERAPDDPGVRWEAAQYFLKVGDFERGWPLYEARFAAGERCHVWHYPFAGARWEGQPLAGRHLLVHGEQGLGDEIMFLSLIPELLDANARVTLVAHPVLAELWRSTFPQCRVFTQPRQHGAAWTRTAPSWISEVDADPIDYQIPFGSLPLYCRRTHADFARQRPYLNADPERVADWKIWLDEHLPTQTPATKTDRLRVGIVWAGNPNAPAAAGRRKDTRRSVGLGPLAPLGALPNIDWVSVQVGAGPIPAAGLRPLDTSSRLSDFRDTAALVAALDLVVTVDTSVAHLAGALDKPVWILLPFAGEFRWGTDPDRSLWWPSARLFRQTRPGAWGAVVDRVAAALLNEAART